MLKSPTRGMVVVRPLGGRISGRIHLRSVAVCGGIGLAIIALSCYALSSGSLTLPVSDVVSALLGNADQRTQLVVVEWRLPRIATAIVFGAALGASGAIFQSVTRNPLGSPDVIGFDSGAITGALIAIVVVGANPLGVSFAAVAGGLATAFCVLVLGINSIGTRLVVIGIALNATLMAFNQLMIMRADYFKAFQVTHWMLGSVESVGWSQLAPATAVIAVSFAIVALLSRSARLVEMHGDEAKSFGVRPAQLRIALIVLATLLVAVPTSIAGPITFIALVAPHLARQLTRRPGLAIASASFMGALVLLVSDFVIQRLPIDADLPVGIATLVFGGGYFIFLLVHELRNVR
jgi:iron complex transport system permease protein